MPNFLRLSYIPFTFIMTIHTYLIGSGGTHGPPPTGKRVGGRPSCVISSMPLIERKNYCEHNIFFLLRLLICIICLTIINYCYCDLYERTIINNLNTAIVENELKFENVTVILLLNRVNLGGNNMPFISWQFVELGFYTKS